jgi:hypothetical protein
MCLIVATIFELHLGLKLCNFVFLCFAYPLDDLVYSLQLVTALALLSFDSTLYFDWCGLLQKTHEGEVKSRSWRGHQMSLV